MLVDRYSKTGIGECLFFSGGISDETIADNGERRSYWDVMDV
jgi:hypothetical protein